MLGKEIGTALRVSRHSNHYAPTLRQFCCGKVGVLVINHLGEVGVLALKSLLDENWYPLFGIMLYLTT